MSKVGREGSLMFVFPRSFVVRFGYDKAKISGLLYVGLLRGNSLSRKGNFGRVAN